MLRWPSTQGVMGDDPPYLSVGTEVSAKYKGAFCEAKVRKVVRSVKCRVSFKSGLGTAVVTDDQIRGTLRVGSIVEVKHTEKKDYVEATISKIQDCSQYTVVFDDGDITTLRRTALCLKSGRHFAESETLDQLPLTHPEHFGNPVVGSRRGGRRSRNAGSDESSDEEDVPQKGKMKEEKEADIGKVVCVELGDKKKQKDNWFPGLVVAPTAQEVVRIRVKDEYLVRSFKDGRYFTVPKKEATEFTREIGSKVDNNTLKTAVDKALLYLDKDELPPHWDRDLLFGLEDVLTNSDSDAAFDSDSSDDEPREEKDHFVAQLYKFMDDRGTPINRGPQVAGRDIDLYKLFKVVHKLGGYNRVTNQNQWKAVSHKLGFGQILNTANLVKVSYKKFLHSFEDFYRKLGCTMVNHPRGNRARHRGGRSLIRDRDRATPVNTPRGDSKDKGSDNAECEDGDQSERRDEVTDLANDEEDVDEVTRREMKEDLPMEVNKINLTEREGSSTEDKDERPQRPQDRPPRKDGKSGATLIGKEVESSSKASPGPPPLERKPSDPQIKLVTPKGKNTKKINESSAGKSSLEAKKRVIVHKLKGARVVDEDDDEMEELDVEELEEEPEEDEGNVPVDDDGDKLTTTRSKSKDELTRLKKDVDSKAGFESERKARPLDGSERKPKPPLTAEKRSVRSINPTSEKKVKSVSQDHERKTVRSLAAEFEKKARGPGDPEKKDRGGSDTEKKGRPPSAADGEKKIRPALTATLEKKKSSTETEKKARPALGSESEKKVRPIIPADGERKKVRPSLTADPTKKNSRVDDKRKFDGDRKSTRPGDSDKDDAERKSKLDTERKVNTPDSGRLSSSADSDRKSSKSDSGDSDKKGGVKIKKDDEKKKLQIRKRKESDDISAGVDESLDKLPSYKSVSVGDRLKVYYGPTHESKVTYEAKVLEIEGEGQDAAFLVHYTGWNNRYDEWIKRSRIADNLSWSPARAKRRHQTQLTGNRKTLVKRRTITPGRDTSSPQQKDQLPSIPMLPGSEKFRDSQPPRSTTPSSVTSSSSRTKSPATRPGSARVTRNTTGETAILSSEQAARRTRTRRNSGQTDMVSESESETYESESEAEPSLTRKSNRRMALDKDDDGSKRDGVSKRKVKKQETEVEAVGDDKEDEKDEDKDDCKEDDIDASSESTSEDKAPVKRTRMGTKIVHDQKVVIKVELDDDDDDDDEGEEEEEEEEAAVPPNQPAKGRDFDLNQIRSELKGFDKAVKIVTDSVCEKNDSEELVELHEEKIIPTLETDEPSTDMEDIYEFKEPEPFEFDMRSKREPSVERTGKLQKRPLSRIFDDVEKSDKNIMKKKVLKTKTGDSESSEDGSPGKKRFRRTVGKKDEDLKAEELSEAPELTPEKEAIVDPATPQKKIFSTSDDAFEKLRQSPSYRFSSSPVRVRTPTPSSPPTVPSPLHSPPQTSSITTLPPTLSHSINRVQSQVSVPKPIPVRITGTSGSSSKHSSQGVSSKLSSAQSVKLSSLKPVPSVVVPLIPAQMPSQPPTLVTPPSLSTDSVKISSLCLSKSSEWLDSKLGSEKQVHVPIIPKVEREECLPPLVSPSHTVRVLDRTSPEPPQLLPMFGPPSKPLHESTRQEVKEIPMPQIKKETILETDLSPQRERSESRPNIRHSIRPSVRPSVRPAVRPAIRPAVRPEARLETHTEVKPDVNLEVRAPVIRSEAACPDLENRDIPHPLIIRPDVIHVDVSRMESSCAEGTRGGALYSGTLRQEAACAESTSSEIVRHEVVRPEALRKQAVRQEAARAESLRRETAFSEVVKAEPDALKISIPEPGCAKPASQNTSAPGESSVLNLCIEAVHSEAACPEPICFESARPDSYQVETFRPEIVRVETVRPEMLRKEAVRQEAARSEAMRSEGVRQEAIRPDTLRKEAVRQEAARSESALNLRLETTCIGASRPESTHHEVLCSEAPHPDQVCQGTALPEVVCQESVYAEKLSSEAVPTAYIETVSLKVECPEVEHDEYTSDTMDIEINRSDSPILSKLSPSVNTITISPSAIKEEVPDNSESPSRRGPRRKVHMKRKKAVSKEYIFDSESDSSDEGRRLVIDKCESSDSCAESFDGRLHPVDKEGASTRKQPGHKKPEASLDLYKNSPVKKEDLSMVYTKPRDSIITAPNSVIVENAPAEVIVKCEEPEEIEVDSNLCSLLCEETIPGSPAPANDTPADAALESDSSGSAQRLQDNSKVPAGKVLEMPFASVPGNTRTPGPSTTASAGLLQHSKTGLVHHGDSSDHGKAGSSASAAGSVKQDVTEAAPVMDNTPPTTPESSISTISNSPRGERGESPPVPDNDSVKSHRDSEDTDNKDGHDSEDDLEPQSSKRSTSLKKGSQESERERDRGDAEPITSPLPKKRRRSRKTSESEERQKRPRHAANRTPVRGSDSDDNSENTAPTSIPQVPQTPVAALHSQSQAARSPRPSKYNFYVDFAPELDASQRIALLQQKLQELRKTYASVKAQLACIDRRRKKLRRREREAYLEARKLVREARKQAREQQISCS